MKEFIYQDHSILVKIIGIEYFSHSEQNKQKPLDETMLYFTQPIKWTYMNNDIWNNPIILHGNILYISISKESFDKQYNDWKYPQALEKLLD